MKKFKFFLLLTGILALSAPAWAEEAPQCPDGQEWDKKAKICADIAKEPGTEMATKIKAGQLAGSLQGGSSGRMSASGAY